MSDQRENEKELQELSLGSDTVIGDVRPPERNVPLERTCPSCGLVVSARVTKCPSDGTLLVEAAAIGQTFAGKYEFVSRIAEGGMGAVYKIRHLQLNQFFAIKLMHHHLSDETALKRFTREAKTTLTLRHPGVVAVHDFGISEHGQAFIVMDYVEGKTLHDFIRDCSPSRSQIVDIFQQICDALNYAHSQGIVHRDIKPSNIMLESGPDGSLRARILDFGIAKSLNPDVAESTLTATGEIIGSPLYMSPEQGRGIQPDERSDIYSLGCTLFEVLSGKPPFIADTVMQVIVKHINDDPPLLRDISPDKSVWCFDEILQKSLAKDPPERFQSMAHFAKALSPYAQSEIATRKPPSRTTTGPELNNQVALIIIWIATLALTLGCVAAIIAHLSHKP